MQLLASKDFWTLLENETRGSPPWRSLILLGPSKKRRQKIYNLGWNGERLAAGADVKLLAKRFPEIELWVIEIMETAMR